MTNATDIVCLLSCLRGFSLILSLDHLHRSSFSCPWRCVMIQWDQVMTRLFSNWFSFAFSSSSSLQYCYMFVHSFPSPQLAAGNSKEFLPSSSESCRRLRHLFIQESPIRNSWPAWQGQALQCPFRFTNFITRRAAWIGRLMDAVDTCHRPWTPAQRGGSAHSGQFEFGCRSDGHELRLEVICVSHRRARSRSVRSCSARLGKRCRCNQRACCAVFCPPFWGGNKIDRLSMAESRAVSWAHSAVHFLVHPSRFSSFSSYDSSTRR